MIKKTWEYNYITLKATNVTLSTKLDMLTLKLICTFFYFLFSVGFSIITTKNIKILSTQAVIISIGEYAVQHQETLSMNARNCPLEMIL